MLRVVVCELENVVGEECRVVVEKGTAAVLRTKSCRVVNGRVTFQNEQLFVALSEFLLQASLLLAKREIVSFQKASPTVRKFAMAMAAGSRVGPILLKLKGNAHLSLSGDPYDGEALPIASRCKALLNSLQEREGAMSPVVSRDGDALATSKRRNMAIATPVVQGYAKPNSDFLRPVIHDGSSVRIVAVLVEVGDAVTLGTRLFEVSLASETRDAPVDGMARSYVYSEPDFYALASENVLQQHEYDELSRANRASGLFVVCWTCKDACLLTDICVSAGMVVASGAVLCVGDCSPLQQKLAHMAAADKIQIPPSGEGLNERYQGLCERLIESIAPSTMDSEGLLQCCAEVEKVAHDFVETARVYGRLIISELHLPLERKTIRPVKIGGVLGGSKYIVRGVLFKIPVAGVFSDYPDPMHFANKVQGHELKGLKAYFGWFFNRGQVGLVSFPLAAVIDYKGHRITAMTQLPINGKESLVYGADDAALDCCVKNVVPEWSAFVREASVGLNLKPHFVVNGRAAGGEIEIASCVDLEGHIGSDRRFYLLDFSTTFPCAFKDSSACLDHDKMWPFYHMLRPEFVKKWGKPLCPDAFSSFQCSSGVERRAESKRNNQDVREASAALTVTVVDCVCGALLVSLDQCLSMRHLFHQEGLNMRYLGLVYRKLLGEENSNKALVLVTVEALVRVLKGELRMFLRKAQSTSGEFSDSILLSCAAAFLNQAFCGALSLEAWLKENDCLKQALVGRFNFLEEHAASLLELFYANELEVEDASSTGSPVLQSLKFAVLSRVNVAAGLGIKATVLDEVRGSGASGFRRNFSQKTMFFASDLCFEESIKYLDVVERAKGLAEFLKSEIEPKMAAEHLLKAYDILECALASSPNDPWLSLLMGRVCAKMHDVLAVSFKKQYILYQSNCAFLMPDARAVKLFHDRALSFFKQAVAFEGNPHALARLGAFLANGDNLVDAEAMLLKSLEQCVKHGAPLDDFAVVALVQVLEKNGNVKLASELRDKTRSFIKFGGQWTEGVGKKSDGGGKDRARIVVMGKKTRDSSGDNACVKSTSTASAGLGPVRSLGDLTVRMRDPLMRSFKRIGETISKRKSPRSPRSPALSSDFGEEEVLSLIEPPKSPKGETHDLEHFAALLQLPPPAKSEDGALTEDDEKEKRDAGLYSDVFSAVKRNQDLRAALSELTDQDEELEIANGLQELLGRRSVFVKQWSKELSK